MDSLSEEDTKDVQSLKAALRREFGNSSRVHQDSIEKRHQQPEETYSMFLSSLRSLFRGAFPGTDTETPVAAALVNSRFLDGISPTVSAQLRLMFADVTVDKLPEHVRRVDEALSSPVSKTAPVQQVNEDATAAAQNGELAQLRGEVAELSRMVQSQFVPAGRLPSRHAPRRPVISPAAR